MDRNLNESSITALKSTAEADIMITRAENPELKQVPTVELGVRQSITFYASIAGLGFLSPSELRTLVSSVRQAATHTADTEVNLRLSKYVSKQAGQSEEGRRPVSCY